MSIVGLDHVQLAIPPDGEDRARHFYGALLGLEEEPRPASMAGRGGAWFRSGRARLHLGVEADFRPARKAHPALLVEDLADLSARLESAGIEVVPNAEVPGCRRAFTHDPFGNRIELIQDGDGSMQRG